MLLVALTVRLYAASHAQNIARDAPIYLTMARQFTLDSPSNVIHKFQYHPGYPAMIAAVARVTGVSWPDGWIAVARGVSIVMSLLALAMMYLFARKAMGQAFALVTVLLFGLTQTFIEVSSDALSDAPAAAFFMCSVVMGLKARDSLSSGGRSAGTWAALAGAAAGIGYLIRPEELLGALLCGLVLLWRPRNEPGRRPLQAASLVALVLGTVAFVLPYAMAIGALTQKKSLSDFALAGSAWPTLASISSSSWPLVLLEAMRRALDRSRDMMSTPLTVLAGVCWITWIGRYVLRIRPPESVVTKVSPPAGIMMAGASIVMFALMTSLEFHHSRYISSRHALPMVLLLAPCAAAGLFTLVEWTNLLIARLRAPGRRVANFFYARPGVAVYLWLLISVAAVGSHAMTVPHYDKGCYRQIGREIRDTFGPGHRVLATDTLPPFFAEAPAEQFEIGSSRLDPQHDLESPDALWRRASGGKYEFVVISLVPAPKHSDIALRRTSELVEAVRKDGRFAFVAASSSLEQSAWLFRVQVSPE